MGCRWFGDVLRVLLSAQEFSASRRKRQINPLRAALLAVECDLVVQDCRWMLLDTFEGVVVMKKSDITYILSSVFMASMALFYCCTMWFHIKLPRYYPLQHCWKWVNEKGVPSQGWYGMQAFAFLTAGIVTLVAYFVLKWAIFTEITLKPTVTRILGVVVTLIVIMCMAYMLYYEFDRWGILSS